MKPKTLRTINGLMDLSETLQARLDFLEESVETFMRAFQRTTPRSSQTVSALLHRDLNAWVQRDLGAALEYERGVQ
jgi:hypothetical protein